MRVETNIYYEAHRLIHPFQIRIQRKGKQVYFCACATLEEAIRRRNAYLEDELGRRLREHD